MLTQAGIQAGMRTGGHAAHRLAEYGMHPHKPRPHHAGIGPEMAALSEAAKARALKHLLAVGLLGTGLGAGVSGLSALGSSSRTPIDDSDSDVQVPYPQLDKAGAAKRAGVAESLVHQLMPTPADAPTPNVFSPAWLRGDSQTNPLAIPWAIPGMAAAGVGGLALGGHLVRDHFRKKRKAEMEEELAKAQKEYEEAMLGQYDPARLHKMSSAKVTMNDLCDMIEKRGSLNSLAGMGAGGYLTLASLLAGGTGLGTYRYLKARSRGKLLHDALKQRALLRSMQNPSDIYLRPVPSHLADLGVRSEEEGDPEGQRTDLKAVGAL